MAGRDTTTSQMIGSRIKAARTNNKMSQADLAAKANISLPHISDIELGKSNMMLTTFIRIAEALQVSTDSLLRPDVPGVKKMYESELSDIFSDCSPSQMDSILKIVKELKHTMSQKDEY